MRYRPQLFSSGYALVSFIAHEKSFRGIGPKNAQALYDYFGDELCSALLSSEPRIRRLLGEENALMAQSAMEENVAVAELCETLDELRLDAAIHPLDVMRIVRAWSKEGLAAIKDNPFNLLSVLGWKKVCEVAKALGVAKDDPRYFLAAVDQELMQVLSNNDTWIQTSELKSKVEKRLGCLIGDEILHAAILTGGAIALADGMQPRGAARMEAQCALWLTEMSQEAPRTNLLASKPSEQEIEEAIAEYEAGQAFSLTDAQRGAIRASHRHRAFVLCGYAGSGKTTVLRGVCETLERFWKRPKIMTLSGRAAKRAAESTGREAITIARFLKEHWESEEDLNEDTVVIVDEASMLALPDLWRILSRLGDASIILCGDPAQLPPISFGLVFHVLAGASAIPRVTLDRVMRQREDSGIPAIAEGIRDGILHDLPVYQGQKAGVSFIHCSQCEAITHITKIGRDLTREGTCRDDIQIIGAVRAGPAGVNAINSFYHEMKSKRGAKQWPSFHHICEGEPFIFNKNDYDRGLTNGSMGRVDSIGSQILATVDGQGMELEVQDGLITELAYAITVHKAQGSQWKRVIVPVFSNRLIDRALIYTALTRAQEQVIFVGDLDALKHAVVKHSSAEKRRVGFRAWLSMAQNSGEGARSD
tara:strand:+ start:137 stop:2077 length:1941 start_codon:yes stop_codon:yes gene_type:complete